MSGWSTTTDAVSKDSTVGVITDKNAITFDTTNKKITFSQQVVVMNKREAIFVNNQPVIDNYESIVAAGRLGVLLLDLETTTFLFIDFHDGAPPRKYLIIGYFQNNGFFGQPNKSAVLVSTSYGWKKEIGNDAVAHSLLRASVSGDYTIDIDLDNGVIDWKGAYLIANGRHITITNQQVNFSTGGGIQYIVFNVKTNKTEVKMFTDEFDRDVYYYIGSLRANSAKISGDFQYRAKKNGEWFTNIITERVESKLVLLPQTPVIVDFSTSKISFPQTHVMQRNDNFTTIAPADVSFNAGSGMIQYVYMKRSDSTVVTVEAFQAYPADAILIGALRGGGINSVSFDFPYVKKGTNDTEGFSLSLNRLLLPDRLYLSTDMPLNIYKSSISPTNKNNQHYKTAACLNGIDFDYFDSLKLKASDVGNKLTIALDQKENTNVFYKKELAVSKIDPATKAGSTVIYCALGDSLTYNDTPAYLKRNLALRSITANIIGTVPNGQATADDGTVYTAKSEGRASWSFSDFIGRRNKSAWGNPVQRVTTKVSETTLEQNPYLKLATSADKSNYPAWCFRNTGADLEKSYADDTDKTGNFYIFDFKFFLDTQELPTPDVVTIALGTNDYWKFGNDFLVSCKLGLDVMVRQIKKDYPNIKIGIVPGQARGTTEDGIYNYSTYTAPLIENVCSMVREYQKEFTGISVIPVWMHQSDEFIFEGDKQDVSAINNVQKIDKGDTTHFIAIGRDQYAKATTAWILNQL